MKQESLNRDYWHLAHCGFDVLHNWMNEGARRKIPTERPDMTFEKYLTYLRAFVKELPFQVPVYEVELKRILEEERINPPLFHDDHPEWKAAQVVVIAIKEWLDENNGLFDFLGK
jgi:hypothetical protein